MRCNQMVFAVYRGLHVIANRTAATGLHATGVDFEHFSAAERSFLGVSFLHIDTEKHIVGGSERHITVTEVMLNYPSS